MDSLKKVVTKDGSITFFNEAANEHYHTLTGALEEAELKHLEPVKAHLSSGSVICDFCYGLGYNSFATLAYCKSQKYDVTVVALENDLEIIRALVDIALPEKYDQYRKDILALLETEPVVVPGMEAVKKYESRFDFYTLLLFVGDATKTITLLPKESVTVLYFDPFSLRKTPEMWDAEVFVDVFNSMKSSSILTTYSCSRFVRNNMAAAGFSVIDGPVVGRKAPGTLALKSESSNA
jgi:tRNA U34 5-methylaminomethyl-2-thiouridine-forming methyltransferase MnmC